ncbi:MAG: potassium channel family protein [Acidimicrobiales bacterium]
MHVIVVGCGRVGSGLAATLESQGHTVAVIDRRAEAFRRLPPDFSGRTIVGVGFDRARLLDAGVGQAGALAAVTNGDNSNIVVARVAREAFSIDRVVARIYDQRRAAIYERLGIPTVATVQWTIERVLRRILPDTAGVEWIDPSAQVCLVERSIPDTWAGHPLDDLESPGVVRVAGLSRLGKGAIPTSGLLAQEGDLVWLAVSGESIDVVDAALAAGPAKGGH